MKRANESLHEVSLTGERLHLPYQASMLLTSLTLESRISVRSLKLQKRASIE